eukprot:15452829-Alexandrium_andersonii.AAC.1
MNGEGWPQPSWPLLAGAAAPRPSCSRAPFLACVCSYFRLAAASGQSARGKRGESWQAHA